MESKRLLRKHRWQNVHNFVEYSAIRSVNWRRLIARRFQASFFTYTCLVLICIPSPSPNSTNNDTLQKNDSKRSRHLSVLIYPLVPAERFVIPFYKQIFHENNRYGQPNGSCKFKLVLK